MNLEETTPSAMLMNWPNQNNNNNVSRNNCCLFLGDLSIYCKEIDVLTLFEQYGPIESVTIKKGFSDRHQSKYGFLTYKFQESAQRAIQELQGALILGRPVRIAVAQRRGGTSRSPSKVSSSASSSHTAQIQFSFISRQTSFVISELSLREIFSEFGEVVDVMIKKSQFDEHHSVQHGYGFIHYPMSFEGIYSALKAVQSIHQVTVGDVTYDTTLSTSLRAMIEHDADLWKIWEELHKPGEKFIFRQSSGLTARTSPASSHHRAIGTSRCEPIASFPGHFRAASQFSNEEMESTHNLPVGSIVECATRHSSHSQPLSEMTNTGPDFQFSPASRSSSFTGELKSYVSRSSSVYSANTTLSTTSAATSFSPHSSFYHKYSK